MLDTRSIPDVPAAYLAELPDMLRRCKGRALHVGAPTCPSESALASIHLAVVIALNMNYAQRHAHRFRYLHAAENPGDWTRAWNKVFYLTERSAQAAAYTSTERTCHWLLMLDSDAYVHSHMRSVTSELDLIASRYQLLNTTVAVLSREQTIAQFQAGIEWVNPGVLLARPSRRACELGLAWQWIGQRSGSAARSGWPAEMGVITEMLQGSGFEPASKLASAWREGHSWNLGEAPQAAVLQVNMTELNSPWGGYVRHFFNEYNRNHLLGQALALSLNIFGPWNHTGRHHFLTALSHARQHVEAYQPRVDASITHDGHLPPKRCESYGPDPRTVHVL